MRKEDLILRKIEELSEKVGSMDVKFEAKFGALDAKIDSVDAKLGAKIDSVDAKLGAKIDAVDAKLGAKIDGIDARLSGQVDWLAAQFLGIHEKMDGLATNERVDRLHEQVMTVLDGHTSMLTRLDGERIASISRFERIEQRVGL